MAKYSKKEARHLAQESVFEVPAYEKQILQTIPYYQEIQQQIIELVRTKFSNKPVAWLDTGCGTGTLARSALQQVKLSRLALSDPSSFMLEQAKAALADAELPVAFEKFDGEAGDAAAGALDGGAEDLGYLRREAANGFDDRSVEIVLDRDPGPDAAGDRFCRTFCRIEVDPSVGQSDGDRCEAQIPEGGGFSEEFGGKLRPTVDAEGVGFRRIKIHCQPLLVALVEGRVDSPDLLAVPKKFDGEIRCFRPVGLNGGGEAQPNPFGWILYKLFQRGIQRIGAADLHRDPRRRRGLEFNRSGGLAPSGGDSGVEPVEIGIDKFRGGERQRRENGEKQRQLHDSALLSFVIIVPEIVAVGAAVGAAAAAHQLRMRFGIDMEIDVQDVSGLSVAAADLLLLQNRIG